MDRPGTNINLNFGQLKLLYGNLTVSALFPLATVILFFSFPSFGSGELSREQKINAIANDIAAAYSFGEIKASEIQSGITNLARESNIGNLNRGDYDQIYRQILVSVQFSKPNLPVNIESTLEVLGHFGFNGRNFNKLLTNIREDNEKKNLKAFLDRLSPLEFQSLVESADVEYIFGNEPSPSILRYVVDSTLAGYKMRSFLDSYQDRILEDPSNFRNFFAKLSDSALANQSSEMQCLKLSVLGSALNKAGFYGNTDNSSAFLLQRTQAFATELAPYLETLQTFSVESTSNSGLKCSDGGFSVPASELALRAQTALLKFASSDAIKFRTKRNVPVPLEKSNLAPKVCSTKEFNDFKLNFEKNYQTGTFYFGGYTDRAGCTFKIEITPPSKTKSSGDNKAFIRIGIWSANSRVTLNFEVNQNEMISWLKSFYWPNFEKGRK